MWHRVDGEINENVFRRFDMSTKGRNQLWSGGDGETKHSEVVTLLAGRVENEMMRGIYKSKVYAVSTQGWPPLYQMGGKRKRRGGGRRVRWLECAGMKYMDKKVETSLILEMTFWSSETHATITLVLY